MALPAKLSDLASQVNQAGPVDPLGAGPEHICANFDDNPHRSQQMAGSS